MATKQKQILGIDIDAGEIRIVQVSGTWNDFRVVQADSIPTPPGLLDGSRIVSPVEGANALRTLLTRMNLSTRDAVLGVGASGVIARVLEIPQVPDEEISLMVEGEMEHYRLLREGDRVFDYMALESVPSAARANRSVLVMAAEDQVLEGYREMAAAAGLRLVALEPIMLGLFRVAYTQIDKQLVEVCLAINCDNAELSIINQGAINLYRRIDIGADDLIHGRRKREAVTNSVVGLVGGLNGPDEVEEPAFESMTEEEGPLNMTAARSLITEMERSLDYYRREFPEAAVIQHIVIASNDPEAELIARWISASSAIEAKMCAATDTESNNPQTSGGHQFLGTQGLAMHALPGHPATVPCFDLSGSKQASNKPRAFYRRIAVSSTVTAVIVLLIAVGMIRLDRQITKRQTELANQRRILAAKQSLLHTRLAKQAELQDELAALRARTVAFAPLVDAVISAMDPQTSLTDVSIDSMGRLQVAGDAVTEQAIINTLVGLRNSRFLDHPTLNSFNSLAPTEKAKSLMHFQVVSAIVGFDPTASATANKQRVQ